MPFGGRRGCVKADDGQLPGIVHAISGTTTNTRRDKMYDNIVFDGRATTEFIGRSGVLDLMTEFGQTEDQALEVCDHFPVWAEFSAVEAGVPEVTVGRTSQVVR